MHSASTEAECFKMQLCGNSNANRKGGSGGGGGCHPKGESAWQLLCLVIDRSWLAIGRGGDISLPFCTKGPLKHPSQLVGSIPGTVGSFQLERAFTGQGP